MALLRLTEAQWKSSFRGLSRHARGNPTARVPTKEYPWQKVFILIHGEQDDAAPLLTAAVEDVLNCAAAQKHSLQDALSAAHSTDDKHLMILRVGA
jgi:hypothetical protein